MSFDAMTWAMDQPVGKSPHKFVLVTLAMCVNADGAEMTCWPSQEFIAERTAQDIKTVRKGLLALQAEGFIEPIGKRTGKRGNVTVYRLLTTKSGSQSNPADAPTGDLATSVLTTNLGSKSDPQPTESGGQSAADNPTVFPFNPTVFPSTTSQISRDLLPDLVEEQVKEQGRNKERKRKAAFEASAFPLPESIDRADWARWCNDRKARGKVVTEDAASLQVKKLLEYRAAGFTPREVIENSIGNGYQGLFPPKRERSAGPARRGGFRELDYSEGTNDGIPEA